MKKVRRKTEKEKSPGYRFKTFSEAKRFHFCDFAICNKCSVIFTGNDVVLVKDGIDNSPLFCPNIVGLFMSRQCRNEMGLSDKEYLDENYVIVE